MKTNKIITHILFLSIVLAVGITIGYFLTKPKQTRDQKTINPNQKYISFLQEVYETIKANYWQEIKDPDLINLFLLASQKITGLTDVQTLKDKADLEKYLDTTLSLYQDQSQKKEYTATLTDMVLSNLTPFGRSRLYTKREQDNLRDTIANKNPQIDQYQMLGLDKSSSLEDVNRAYQQKIKGLDPVKDSQTIAELETAKNTIGSDYNKALYDQYGIESSVSAKILDKDTLYLKISKFSNTTFEEMVNLFNKIYETNRLTNLILDLRDNIGGNIDSLPHFLGPFIGADQYAYQFFHQGNKTDFKTKTGWLDSLVSYKKVIILINQNSQSTAELMASVLKKYNVGVLVGTPTKGWGTVEKIFPIQNKIDDNENHSVFLVHSLTLREDGQPIEENKVIPSVNVHQKDWQKELFKYYSDQNLINQVELLLR